MTSDKRPSKRERIELLADLMAAGRYRTRETARALEAKWGVSYRTVENDACEAARLLRISPEDVHGRRAEVAARFEKISKQALATTSAVTGLPDFKAAIAALALYGKYAGLEPVEEVRHSGEIALDSLDALRARVKGVAKE